ncbi:hypothetical protein DSAG12_00373 [Promethearchaeum syntrophicum]|uniref:Uncharacterized protein n=1 Tax=Promethearchaeum syntrophicum TaxID=2594042 RepID=A0A5B9D6U8_9ARCH|nr:hypothetical protein [Candidatus Prometheoarchaeum syntrophicum]QEE14560.1 hypothetical protein DSAG12_00373 [Candidatus Prometheoarchaeum syntrophicum]
MISKLEAEEKLLKIFYDVKLDRYLKKTPTHANIDMFEETKDLNHLEHFYKVKDDELVIAMWANSYEHGIPFFAVNMAIDSAESWRGDPLSKYLIIYTISHMLLPLIFFFLGYIIKSKSLFGAILINLIVTGVIIYFVVLKNNWKKRVLIRYREFFDDTGISISEEKFKQYSKRLYNDFSSFNTIQCFAFFLLLLSWVIIFT